MNTTLESEYIGNTTISKGGIVGRMMETAHMAAVQVNGGHLSPAVQAEVERLLERITATQAALYRIL